MQKQKVIVRFYTLWSGEEFVGSVELYEDGTYSVDSGDFGLERAVTAVGDKATKWVDDTHNVDVEDFVTTPTN